VWYNVILISPLREDLKCEGALSFPSPFPVWCGVVLCELYQKTLYFHYASNGKGSSSFRKKKLINVYFWLENLLLNYVSIRIYCTRRRHHHLSAAFANLDPKNWERSPQNRGQSPPTDEDRDPPCLHGPKATKTGDLRRRRREATRSNRPCLESPTNRLWLKILIQEIPNGWCFLVDHEVHFIFNAIFINSEWILDIF
jgi:hypothetical protein